MAGVQPRALNLRTARIFGLLFLEIQDGLLAEIDEKLPFSRHVVGTMQHFHVIEDFVFIMLVWAQEVIISDPQSQVIVGAIDIVKAVGVAVGSFVGAVEPFDHLFEGAIPGGDGIVICKADDLCDLK